MYIIHPHSSRPRKWTTKGLRKAGVIFNSVAIVLSVHVRYGGRWVYHVGMDLLVGKQRDQTLLLYVFLLLRRLFGFGVDRYKIE